MAAFKFRRRRTREGWTAGFTLAAAILFGVIFVAGSGAVSSTVATCSANTLTGSNFEIDPVTGGLGTNKSPYTGGANLVVNGSSPCIDWASTVPAGGTLFSAGGPAKADAGSGSGDDSFAQGTSENDTNPVISTGSIPPNKSDLQAFGVSKETTSAGKFLDLFWSRTSGPTGTTVMDFELNKKSCSQSYLDTTNCYVNSKSATDAQGHPLAEMPIRSGGDKLISYIFSGSATPTVCMFTWSGANSVWTQPGVQISGAAQITNACGTGSTFLQNDALGSINFDGLTEANTFGLGALSALSFGELSVNFGAIFSGTTDCTTFGSAHLSSRSSATFTDELKDFIAPEPVQITNCTTLSTSASNGSTAQTVGGSISDTATVGAVAPTAKVTFTAYGPFDPTTAVTADICGAGNQVFTDAPTGVALTGPDATTGNYSAADSFTPKAAGRYEWIANFLGDTNNVAKSGSCGDTGEQSLVGPKTPVLATTASNGTVAQALGGAITDSASLTGTANKPNGTAAGGSITFKAYSDSSCSTLVFTSSAVPVTGDNTSYGPVSFIPKAAGTYYWTASYTGDLPNTTSKSEDCGGTGESSIVNPNQPAISTVATAGPVALGSALDDTAHLTGTAKEADGTTLAKGTITFSLYGPFNAAGVCTAPAVATRVVNVGGDGYYKASDGTGTGSLTPTAAGTYNWIAAYSGDLPNTKAVSGACGDSSESSAISPNVPAITTTATASVVITNSIDDTAHLSGTALESDGATKAKGTITFNLYGPFGTFGVCTGNPVATRVVNVNGDGDYKASDGAGGAFTPAVAGTYNWIASYSGDLPNTKAVSGTCGDANETSEVHFLPSTIDTVQSWYPNDTATIGGGGGGTVTFTLYKGGTCSSGTVSGGTAVTGLTGLSETVSSTSASTKNGPATGDDTHVAVTAVNTGDKYVWLAVYSGDSTHKPVSSCEEATTFTSLSNGTQQSSG